MKKNATLFLIVCAIFLVSGTAAIIRFHAISSEPAAISSTDNPPSEADLNKPPEPETTTSAKDPGSDTQIATAPQEPPTPDTDTNAADDAPASDDESEAPQPEAAPEPETDTPADEPSEPADEAKPESEEAPSDEQEARYEYTVVPDDATGVRVRKTSDRGSEVIALLSGGDTGIVLEIGDTRSKIMLPDGSVGYVFNEYIQISDLTE